MCSLPSRAIACLNNLGSLLVTVWNLERPHPRLSTPFPFALWSQMMTGQQMALISLISVAALCGSTVDINAAQIIPAAPFTGFQHLVSPLPNRQTVLACVLTSHRVTSPSRHRFSISDSYETEAWDGDQCAQRRSMYPLSPDRMNRSGTTKHTVP